MSPCIQLHSGRVFDFENPTADMVRISDIAYALSGLARFTGHARRGRDGFPYTVAQHSVVVSHLVPSKFALEGLLHDAHEVYVQDLNSPCKKMVPEYKAFENRIERVVRAKFGFGPEMHDLVKQGDLVALHYEVLQLMPDSRHDLWKWVRDYANKIPYPVLFTDGGIDEWLEPWPHNVAHGKFISRYRELTE